MAIDGYFLSAQIKEFENCLLNGKLRKITGESDYSLVFEFFHFGKKVSLLFNVSPNSSHMRLVSDAKNNLSSNFLDVLKKELLNASLINIKQFKKDRIIFFEFQKLDPFLGAIKKTLIFEVMGRSSNLILTNENLFIIDAFKKVFNEEKRSILPNVKYEVYPTTKEVFSYNKLTKLSSPDDLFYQYMGFSREFAEFVYNHKIDISSTQIEPTLYINNKVSFHAYDLKLKGERHSFLDTSSLLDFYYKLTTKSDDYLIKLLHKQKDRQLVKLRNLNSELLKNEEYEQIKLVADNIYSSGLDLNSHYKEFNGYKLEEKLNLNHNAQKLYDKYKRLKNSIDFLNSEITKTKHELKYFEDLIDNFNNFNKDDLIDLKVELVDLGIIREKKKKTKALKKYLIYKLNNATVYVGKTAKQNDEIVNKIAKGEDLWFHVKDYPGAHVILKGEKSEDNIMFAARKALLNSPLKNALNGYVNYTKIKYVKKIKDRPGFYVTYKNSETIFVAL